MVLEIWRLKFLNSRKRLEDNIDEISPLPKLDIRGEMFLIRGSVKAV